VLLRPDRYIAAVFAPEEAPAVCRALATFAATPAVATADR
jgi:hypothetical protein